MNFPTFVRIDDYICARCQGIHLIQIAKRERAGDLIIFKILFFPCPSDLDTYPESVVTRFLARWRRQGYCYPAGDSWGNRDLAI